MIAPTRQQLLFAAREFEGFTVRTIRAQRAFLWGMSFFFVVNVSLVVWQFPVENWFQVVAVLLNIAAAVVGWNSIRENQRFTAEMIQAREAARRTIAQLQGEVRA